MSQFSSCCYFGEVVHQRFSPRRHRLRYRLFQGLFDLDELPRLEGLRLFSHNRFNVFSFYDSDHGHADGRALRAHVEGQLTQAGLFPDGGKIRLLCMPRLFGFVFNPLSIYYCYSRAEKLIAMLYEVRNTFGQMYTYVIPVNTGDDRAVKQECKKSFFVSPFMDMEMIYSFDISLPSATVATRIRGDDSKGTPLILASFVGDRRELSDLTLLKALVAYPLLTVGVVAAIHWEALKLLAKGLRLRRRPSLPAAAAPAVSGRTGPN